MNYHPKFHFSHGKPFTERELEYICKFYEIDHVRTIAFAIGKTERAIHTKVQCLKRGNLYDYYKNRNKYW
ncbi:DNA-entry nuclease [Lysinibacillus macroides]|uniref:DNA-entry nuclease n=2 Tax=Lysinibacillus macroides TaxID=33935 RepID=A0A0N0CVA9_9BACI|nr:hypothetical protein ADM90_19490 [Lysinibacillus macroides]QPR70286.1 DNA-entry nuclease [Lysinibacillus macroides]